MFHAALLIVQIADTLCSGLAKEQAMENNKSYNNHHWDVDEIELTEINPEPNPIDLANTHLEYLARCFSIHCGKTGSVKNVKRNVIDCPDCGHALVWKSERVKNGERSTKLELLQSGRPSRWNRNKFTDL